MRRILLAIFFCAYVCNAIVAQEILNDETLDGNHFVTTSMLPVYSEGDKTGRVSLGVAYNESLQAFFSLNLELTNETKCNIREGNTLQLITFDGEIILLKNTLTMTLDKYINSGKSVIISYGVQYNEKELADLDQIMNENITKLRIETDNGIIERKIKDNEFSKAIYNCFVVLKDNLENKR